MLQFLPGKLKATIAFLLLLINTLFWFSLLFPLAVIKLAIPLRPVQAGLEWVISKLAEAWVSLNKGWINLTQAPHWDIQGVDQLPYRGWYLVSANHQSWVDILLLQYVFSRRIPLLKFFLKQELLYVPIMGLAWWALDFPFMKRYRKEYLKKHPEMKGKDFETTRKACQKFSRIPTSVMNFLEGTRFTPAKQARQQSPYQYLLKPKSGGIALAIQALGDKFHSLLNVTIVYPDGIPTFWDFMQGKMKRVVVRMQQLEIPPHFLAGDYDNDPAFRSEFHAWVQQLWAEKDAEIARIHREIAR